MEHTHTQKMFLKKISTFKLCQNSVSNKCPEYSQINITIHRCEFIELFTTEKQALKKKKWNLLREGRLPPEK